jgi:ribosomal peptide maturation radical SAM protein 1
LSDLEGISWRDKYGSVHHGRPPRPVTREVLDNNPVPDFSEYIKEIQKNHTLFPETKNMFFSLLFESSRGCWKGEKMHCTFCGLNNKGICFRAKDPVRVRKELEYQIKTHGCTNFMATDCIFPKNYFQTLIKDIQDNPFKKKTTILCETRTTITRDEVKLLARAGFNFIQSGIENLSTNILKAMNKGVTAIKNIHFLKLCRTYGIYPLWNILIRVPGEKREDYTAMNRLIPKIIHLTPPYNGARVVELQRFSPYFSRPGKWADNITFRKWYYGLYPQDKININKIAYFFDAHWKDTIEDPQVYSKITRLTEEWIKIWRFSKILPDLTHRPGPEEGTLIIRDTRSSRKGGTWELDKTETLVYLAADDPVTFREILNKQNIMEQNIMEQNIKKQKIKDQKLIKGENKIIQQIIDSFIKSGLMIKDNNQYLALSVPHDAPVFTYELRSSEINLDEKAENILI